MICSGSSARRLRHAELLIPCFLLGCHRPAPPVVAVTRTDPGDGRDGAAVHRDAKPADALPIYGDANPPPRDDADVSSVNAARHSFTSAGRDFDPDVDPTTQTLALASTRNSEHPDIFLKSINGSTLMQLTNDEADDIQPRFSPDGSRVAFASNRSGNWDIWVVNRDGGQLVQVTRDRADEVSPCWSPDGKQIAFTAWGRQSHQWEIWVTSLDDSAVRRFITPGMFCAWSPDGKRLAFQRSRQRDQRWFTIWTIDLMGDEAKHPTEIASSDESACISPRWSPDGRYVVYCAVRRDVRTFGPTPQSERAELWATELETGLRYTLTDPSTLAFNPTWAADGRVYFVSARSGAENIWSIPAGVGTVARQKPTLNATPIGEESYASPESVTESK
ncbi:MAG: hypothetical protein U1D55_04470 [Phycisphaerae bacterium]